MNEHQPTFTEYRGTHGLVCSCGFTTGGYNELGINRTFVAHEMSETMGMSMQDAREMADHLEQTERSHRVQQVLDQIGDQP